MLLTVAFTILMFFVWYTGVRTIRRARRVHDMVHDMNTRIKPEKGLIIKDFLIPLLLMFAIFITRDLVNPYLTNAQESLLLGIALGLILRWYGTMYALLPLR